MAPADEIVETLYAYDEDGLVDELAVEIWPEEIRNPRTVPLRRRVTVTDSENWNLFLYDDPS